ncbi:MAG TPA: hypothetical protein VNN07_18335 [Candidatus Tectomicrobia bacterium]|nr:hypothetical protein [Candidatus Tectomicrobia bacterium]
MTEYLPDTPVVARPYCPVCEPGADPSREILDVRWCAAHTPSWTGSDDALVSAEAFLSGSAEAGGDDNRRWCQLVHRPVPDEPGAERRKRRAGRLPSSTVTGA